MSKTNLKLKIILFLILIWIIQFLILFYYLFFPQEIRMNKILDFIFILIILFLPAFKITIIVINRPYES